MIKPLFKATQVALSPAFTGSIVRNGGSKLRTAGSICPQYSDYLKEIQVNHFKG